MANVTTVYMKTPDGRSAGVNSKYVEEYKKKGYTINNNISSTSGSSSSGSSHKSSSSSSSSKPTTVISAPAPNPNLLSSYNDANQKAIKDWIQQSGGAADIGMAISALKLTPGGNNNNNNNSKPAINSNAFNASTPTAKVSNYSVPTVQDLINQALGKGNTGIVPTATAPPSAPVAPSAPVSAPKPTTTPASAPKPSNSGGSSNGGGYKVPTVQDMINQALGIGNTGIVPTATTPSTAGSYNNPPASAPMAAPVKPVTTPPANTVGLRDYLKNSMYDVFWNPDDKKVYVNGVPIDTSGSLFTNVNGSIYAPEDAIKNALAQAQVGYSQEQLLNQAMANMPQPLSTEEIMAMIQQQMAPYLDIPQVETLSWDEALDQAGDSLNPMYDQRYKEIMNGVTNNLLSRGFYGQMPGDVLRTEIAGQEAANRNTAISNMAQSMYGQSLENARAYQQMGLSQQQSMMNNILQALQMANTGDQQNFQNIISLANMYGNKDINESNTQIAQYEAQIKQLEAQIAADPNSGLAAQRRLEIQKLEAEINKIKRTPAGGSGEQSAADYKNELQQRINHWSSAAFSGKTADEGLTFIKNNKSKIVSEIGLEEWQKIYEALIAQKEAIENEEY